MNASSDCKVFLPFLRPMCVCVCGCVCTLVPVQVFGKRLDGKKVFYVGVVPLSEIIYQPVPAG